MPMGEGDFKAVMAVRNQHAQPCHLAGDPPNRARIGDGPEPHLIPPKARRGQGRLFGGDLIQEVMEAPLWIGRDAKHGAEIGADRFKHMRAVGLRTWKRGLVAQDLPGGSLEFQQRHQPQPPGGTPLPHERLLAQIHGGLRLADQHPFRAPTRPGVFRPRVAIVLLIIVGQPSAVDQAHDVMGGRLIKLLLLLGGDHIIGRGEHPVEASDQVRVIPQGAKRRDRYHQSAASKRRVSV